MSAFKKGQQKRGDGKYSEAAKLSNGPADKPEAKGREITEVYTNNDLGAVRGGRPDRSENGR